MHECDWLEQNVNEDRLVEELFARFCSYIRFLFGTQAKSTIQHSTIKSSSGENATKAQPPAPHSEWLGCGNGSTTLSARQLIDSEALEAQSLLRRTTTNEMALRQTTNTRYKSDDHCGIGLS